jgi:WD40 repeat protein
VLCSSLGILVFTQHASLAHTFPRVALLSFNTDGKMMVTTSEDDSINLYDCEAGECVARPKPIPEPQPRTSPHLPIIGWGSH